MSYNSYAKNSDQFPPPEGSGGGGSGGGSGPIEGVVLLVRSAIYADVTDLVGGVDVCTAPILTVLTANSFVVEKPAGSVVEVSLDEGVSYYPHPVPIPLPLPICSSVGVIVARLRVVGTTNYVGSTLIATDNLNVCSCP